MEGNRPSNVLLAEILTPRLLGSLVAAAALIALFIFGLASDRSAASGRPAPALPREALSGKPVTLAPGSPIGYEITPGKTTELSAGQLPTCT